MIICPLQSFGIGDIIYCQTLVRKLAMGDKILWGTEPQFVEGLSRAYPDVMFVDKQLLNIDYNRRDIHDIYGVRVHPIRWSDANLNVPYTQCMSSKYEYYGMDYKTWKENAMWHRNRYQEIELAKKLLLDFNGEHHHLTLINRFFGSSGQCMANIDATGLEMRTVEGFSLFDWAFIIEKADVIHTVSTSIIYLLEMLELGKKEVHLYPRIPMEKDFKNVEYLLTKPNYIFHY